MSALLNTHTHGHCDLRYNNRVPCYESIFLLQFSQIWSFDLSWFRIPESFTFSRIPFGLDSDLLEGPCLYRTVRHRKS